MNNTTCPHLFWKIFIDFLTSTLLREQNTTLWSKVWRIFFSNFVAFSENPNFDRFWNCKNASSEQILPHCALHLLLRKSRIFWVANFIIALKKWYFVTKIVLTYCETKLLYWSSKTFEIRGWRPRIWKKIEITWTTYSSSERSEQFLVTECFFNLFLEVSQI